VPARGMGLAESISIRRGRFGCISIVMEMRPNSFPPEGAPRGQRPVGYFDEKNPISKEKT
jgi:hypothetical protein